MKDCLTKIFVLRLKCMLGFFLILVNGLTTSVESTELSAKSCFLYPINQDESSPWFTIESNHDTTVLLEHMPSNAPVNITLKKLQSEDTICLLSVRLHRIDIYGNCIIGDNQNFTLDVNNDDKSLVFHVHGALFQISVEDIMVKLNQATTENFELKHNMSEIMDKEDLTKENVPMDVYDDDQYVLQITSEISEEDRLHAAVGCEYDTDDECIMEFEKTILCIKDEITLMAISNSTELEGEVFVHYGNSEFKRMKPLVMPMPLPNLEEVNTWEEVANITPTFLEREGSEGLILFLEKNLIYSRRNPGLVGTVIKKELILDFTNTSNVKWGVPCPEKPETLNINFTVISTKPEKDAEMFIPDGGNEEIDSNMMDNMVRGELELDPDFDPEYDAQLNVVTPEALSDSNVQVDEPEPEPEPEEETDGSESAQVRSNAMSSTPKAIILMIMHLIVFLTTV